MWCFLDLYELLLNLHQNLNDNYFYKFLIPNIIDILIHKSPSPSVFVLSNMGYYVTPGRAPAC